MKALKKTLAGVLTLLLLLSVNNCEFGNTGSETDDSTTIMSLLGGVTYLNSLNLVIAGSWTDTSDSNALYTITNSEYSRPDYLGTAPKTAYNMSIIEYNNTDQIMKMSGLQLDFAAFPTITTKTNTIYQRIRFHVADANTYYYCTEVFNKNSLAELNADATTYTYTSPTGTTCNGFVWSKMTRN